jgi:iron complex transport system permease protein
MRTVARIRLRAAAVARWPGFWAAFLLLLLLATALVAVRFGAVSIPTDQLAEALFEVEHPMHAVLIQVRLPRVVAGALVGASLAIAGLLLQTVVRNPLADPGLLGINAGAGLAALAALVIWPDVAVLLPLFSFLGALAAVIIILLAAWGPRRRLGPLKLILSGVAVQSVLFAAIALVTFLYADRAPAFVSFTVGSLNGAGWSDIRWLAPLTLVGTLFAFSARRSFDLLLLDDATAAGVGLGVQRTRLLACGCAALLASVAVSAAGLVGFVGLVVPNAVRLATGPHHRTLVPLSAIGGAALVALADLAARTVAAPLELPVGALLALIGGPYFLFILWRQLP